MADGIYTVSELTMSLKATLESGFPDVLLRGEVSNFKRHSSGHLYFTLKDSSAQINAIVWRSAAARLGFEMEDGVEVLARGRVEVYAPQGKYQIICDSLKEVGAGDLQQAFQRLLKKLEAEGLFNPEHKKALPRLPERIGIITSPTGAVIEDIASVLSRRFPLAELVLFPTRVQGEESVSEMIAALRYFNDTQRLEHRVDVIILGRGGGSMEDLWAFNDEALARAVFQSEIPVVSAVGHQTDYTICDFVADVRAGTPSMAAELVAPASADILAAIAQTLGSAQSTLLDKIESQRGAVREIAGSYAFNKPKREVDTLFQTLDRLTDKLDFAIQKKWGASSARLNAVVERLGAIGYEQTLRRGFALAFKNGALVREAATLSPNDELTLRFADGEKIVKVIG